jgi:hypothetical protein
LLLEKNTCSDIARKDKTDFDNRNDTDAYALLKEIFGNAISFGIECLFENVVS